MNKIISNLSTLFVSTSAKNCRNTSVATFIDYVLHLSIILYVTFVDYVSLSYSFFVNTIARKCTRNNFGVKIIDFVLRWLYKIINHFLALYVSTISKNVQEKPVLKHPISSC